MSSQIVNIKNWSFGTRPIKNGLIPCLFGNTEGHPRLLDGPVWTSSVIEFKGRTVRTKNSVYRLIGPMDPAYRAELRRRKTSLKADVERLIKERQ